MMRTSCFDSDFASHMKLTKRLLIHCFVLGTNKMVKIESKLTITIATSSFLALVCYFAVVSTLDKMDFDIPTNYPLFTKEKQISDNLYLVSVTFSRALAMGCIFYYISVTPSC